MTIQRDLIRPVHPQVTYDNLLNLTNFVLCFNWVYHLAFFFYFGIPSADFLPLFKNDLVSPVCPMGRFYSVWE